MWINCTPSARLCETSPDAGNTYATERLATHTLCEYILRIAIGEDMSQVADVREHFSYYNK